MQSHDSLPVSDIRMTLRTNNMQKKDKQTHSPLVLQCTCTSSGLIRPHAVRCRLYLDSTAVVANVTSSLWPQTVYCPRLWEQPTMFANGKPFYKPELSCPFRLGVTEQSLYEHCNNQRWLCVLFLDEDEWSASDSNLRLCLDDTEQQDDNNTSNIR